MNYFKPTVLAAIPAFILFSCATSIAQTPSSDKGSCYVHLFDGKNYKDDNIVVKGPGEYADLRNLPGSNKDWDDEADSFQLGANTTVTFYSEPNFGGKAVTYKGGAKKPAMEEPRSMKISCGR